jgi:DNA-binding phage protein
MLDDFDGVLHEAIEALLGARGEIRNMSSISRELGRAVPRLERAMSSMVSAMDVGSAFAIRTKRVLEQRIQEFEGNE